jgi:ubiquinone/menaquinone biosynthesis C-methylase UbiE
VISEEGLTRASLDKLTKIDSFIKEAQRLAAPGGRFTFSPRFGHTMCNFFLGAPVNMTRKALKDFTFSNGTFIPAGSSLSVATFSMHLDDVKAFSFMTKTRF